MPGSKVPVFSGEEMNEASYTVQRIARESGKKVIKIDTANSTVNGEKVSEATLWRLRLDFDAEAALQSLPSPGMLQQPGVSRRHPGKNKRRKGPSSKR